MKILGNRVLVSKIDEPVKEGFEAVEVQDSFVFKGKIEQGDFPIQGDNLKEGDIVLFSKYSPDTQEVEIEGQIMKIIKVEDILAIL